MNKAHSLLLQRALSRAMLGALAAACCLAVTTVLFPGLIRDWHLTGTFVCVLVACALMLRAAKSLDAPAGWLAARVACAAIVIEFILLLLAIWLPLTRSADWMLDELVASFAAAAIPLVAWCYVRMHRTWRWAGDAGIAMCAAALGLLVFSAVSVSGPDAPDMWAVAGWNLLWLSALMGGCLAGAGLDRRHWRWAGVLAGIGAYAIGFHDASLNAWFWDELKDVWFWRLLTVCVIVAQANAMLVFPLPGRWRWLVPATLVCSVVSGMALNFGLADSRAVAQQVVQIGTAAGICSACGMLAEALVVTFNRAAREATTSLTGALELKAMTVSCPLCRAAQSLAIGADGWAEAPCHRCGLMIAVQLHVPRCEKCDYALLMLKSDRCPECGEKQPVKGDVSRGDMQVAGQNS